MSHTARKSPFTSLMQANLSGTLLVLLLALFPAALAAREPSALLGDWVLNSELTHEMQPKQKSGGGGGFGTPTISVGGVGIPLPGGSSNAGGGGARDPDVLRCDALTVTMDGQNVHFAYRGAGEESMKPGNDQGRKTTWSSDRLTQKYKTNIRSVRKTYELDRDGRLIVKVNINPKGSKSATHVRVFERPLDPVDRGSAAIDTDGTNTFE